MSVLASQSPNLNKIKNLTESINQLQAQSRSDLE